MMFQFSDGEFSDPIATSLKMWKKKFPSCILLKPPPSKTCCAVPVKYNKGLIWVVTQRFLVTSSLNVNGNLHKVVYTKLEKYIAELDDVCSRLA